MDSLHPTQCAHLSRKVTDCASCSMLKADVAFDLELMTELFRALSHLGFVTRPLPQAQARILRYVSVILSNYACALTALIFPTTSVTARC